MKKLFAIFSSAIAIGLAMFSSQSICPGRQHLHRSWPRLHADYPGYAYYPPYPRYYGYGYPRYGYAYPSYVYGYGRPYYGTYWGQGRRVARRVYRRRNVW